MKPNRLRVYYGSQADLAVAADETADNDRVTVPLGEVFPLLIDAIESQRTWLEDFGDDDVTISNDLYEVLLAYQHCRRPSA
mgnify:CR=1 FL=1